MDIHILDKSPDNKTATCIFHIPISGTNQAGVDWPTVITRDRDTTPLMPWNDAAENENIMTGNVMELKEVVRFSSAYLTNAERVDEIKAAFANRKSALLDQIQNRLQFHGYGLSAE
jgi:hypothetical protein